MEVIIVGTAGKGRSVLDLCRSVGRKVRGFIDLDLPQGHCVNGYSVLGSNDYLMQPDILDNHEVIVAIGRQKTRRDLCLDLLERGAKFATVVHPSAVVSDHARIGVGTAISPFCYVGANSKIGRFCLLSGHAIVAHDAVLEDGVQLAAGASLAGAVYCEESAYIGMGANLIESVRVGARSIIGAGSTVRTDIPSDVVAYGVPAKVQDKK